MQRSISPKDAVIEFGAIVFRNDFSIVRVKSVRSPKGDWRTQIAVHRVENGAEQLPLGYIRGENILLFDQ